MAPDAAMTTPLAGRWSFAIRRTVLARLCCGVAVLGSLLRVCVLCCAAGVFAARGERRNTAQNGQPWPCHEQRGPSARNLLRRPSPARLGGYWWDGDERAWSVTCER